MVELPEAVVLVLATGGATSLSSWGILWLTDYRRLRHDRAALATEVEINWA